MVGLSVMGASKGAEMREQMMIGLLEAFGGERGLSRKLKAYSAGQEVER